MKIEKKQIELKRLERERCQAMADYHKAAEKLDYKEKGKWKKILDC